jgi:hypothetical protein
VPIIVVNEGDDWLQQYRRWKALRWYKRITRRQWFAVGFGTSLLVSIIYAASSWLWPAILRVFGPSLRIFGG